jgi:hypothetical protein
MLDRVCFFVTLGVINIIQMDNAPGPSRLPQALRQISHFAHLSQIGKSAKHALGMRRAWQLAQRAASGHATAAPPRNAMKLRRLMQNCPSRTKPTKGQHCASQQNWPADDAVRQTRRVGMLATLAACPLPIQ